jgi:hypothetical protein
MPDYKAAAKRRNQAQQKKNQENILEPNQMGGIQKLIDSAGEMPDHGGPVGSPQGRTAGQMPAGGGYSGPGSNELLEALQKARSGVNEPGPPQSVVNRMQKQHILTQIQPDIADLAARYGVIPSGPNR